MLELPISAREYQATSFDSEELRTPYVEDDRLDLSAWARDAVALALPLQILCRSDCAGLCPVCGKDLNAEPHAHDEETSDSRWAALAARWLYCAAADGSPEAKNVEVAPRQASRPARHLLAAPEPLSELPPADAAASDVPDVQDVPRPRDRAAPPARLLEP